METRAGVPEPFRAGEVGPEEGPTERQGEFLRGCGVERGRPWERGRSDFQTGPFQAIVVRPAFPLGNCRGGTRVPGGAPVGEIFGLPGICLLFSPCWGEFPGLGAELRVCKQALACVANGVARTPEALGEARGWLKILLLAEDLLERIPSSDFQNSEKFSISARKQFSRSC